ncbi:MAG: hypothetical protein AB7N71_12775 [Phycisphaerae bacterium]
MKKNSHIQDRQIEKLLRIVAEIDALEHGAASLNAAREAPAAATLPRVIRLRRWLSSAIAAAASIVLFSTTIVEPTGTAVATTVPIHVSYVPKVDTTACCRRDCVTSTPAEPCAILAVLHRWSSECQCMVWDLYDWAGGETVARVQAGEAVEVIADVQMPPTRDEVVLFAVARNRTDLPARGQEGAFLDCLLETSDELDRSDASYTNAVKTCLPDSVLVVPQRLVSR